MSHTLPKVSDHLTDILGEFEPHYDGDGIEMDGDDCRAFILRLRAVRSLALSMEQELDVFRLADGHQQAAAFLDQEAAGALDALISDPDGKVITPNFGRKP
jgi:hypothetical protein